MKINPSLWMLSTILALVHPSSVYTTELWNQRFQAHLIIRDYRTACDELQVALVQNPHSQLLWSNYIQALGLKGDEKMMFHAWKRYTQLFPHEHNNRNLIESMAWAVIQEGVNSSSPMIRTYSLLAAFFGNSAKGVDILLAGMQDGNSNIRSISVELSGNLRDDKLKEAVLRQFQNEKDYTVHCALIEALGSMKLSEANPLLIKIIANDDATLEERGLAIAALSDLTETLSRQDAEKLIKSPSAGLRELACQLIISLNLNQHWDLLLTLENDPSPYVRAASFQGLGLLQLTPDQRETVTQLARRHIQDRDELSGISAVWLLTLHQHDEGQQAFSLWLNNESKETRWLASGALATTGKRGLPLIKKMFAQSNDPFIKLNLARALLTQRVDISDACDAIYLIMMQNQEQWMLENKGLFEVLCLSKLKHTGPISNSPEVANQLVRLDLLNMLATQRYPKAQEAIKTFLNQRHWGVTGLASVLLLTEGEDSTVDLIKTLLQDPDQNIRLQAALILALWGRDDSAIAVLQDSYSSASRERKEQILEALGRIRSPSVIPFLIEKMQEPSQSLRLIAAVALIQTING